MKPLSKHNRSEALDALVTRFQELQASAEARRRSVQERHAAEASRRRRPSKLLRRLDTGEITLAAYLDGKLEQALSLVEDVVEPADIAFLRVLGREYLERELAQSGLFARLRAHSPRVLGQTAVAPYTEEVSMDSRQRTAAQLGPSPGSAELQKLKNGELTLDEYVELRLERALARLSGFVSDEQREVLRQTIREQFSTDPVLQEYVRRATGRVPEPPSTR